MFLNLIFLFYFNLNYDQDNFIIVSNTIPSKWNTNSKMHLRITILNWFLFFK